MNDFEQGKFHSGKNGAWDTNKQHVLSASVAQDSFFVTFFISHICSKEKQGQKLAKMNTC